MTEKNEFTVVHLKHLFDRQCHEKTFAVPKDIYSQYDNIARQKTNPFTPGPEYLAKKLGEANCVYYGKNGLRMIAEDGHVSRESDYDTQGKGVTVAYRQYDDNGYLDLARYSAGYGENEAFHSIQPRSIVVSFNDSFHGLRGATFANKPKNEKETQFKITSAIDAENKIASKAKLAELNEELALLVGVKKKPKGALAEMYQIVKDVRKTEALAYMPHWVDTFEHRHS